MFDLSDSFLNATTNEKSRSEKLGLSTQPSNCSCVTTSKIYKSITDASIKTGVGDSNISSSCKGKYNYAGKDKNGNKLHWMYYDDYKNVVELFYGIK